MVNTFNTHGDHKSPKDLLVGPLPNGQNPWLKTWRLLATGTSPGMILQEPKPNHPEHESSGQIIATSHDLTPNGGLVREIPLFQGNLGW